MCTWFAFSIRFLIYFALYLVKKKKTILCKDLRPTTVGPIGLGARLTKGCLKSVFLVRQHDDDGGVPPFLPLVS